jgi:hypothetical protein
MSGFLSLMGNIKSRFQLQETTHKSSSSVPAYSLALKESILRIQLHSHESDICSYNSHQWGITKFLCRFCVTQASVAQRPYFSNSIPWML